jgi:hypothetical protein
MRPVEWEVSDTIKVRIDSDTDCGEQVTIREGDDVVYLGVELEGTIQALLCASVALGLDMPDLSSEGYVFAEGETE